MISQTSEYALRAVVCLAQNPDKPHTTVKIAKWTKVPEHYLSKVMLALAKHEVVYSKKGLHGGYMLAHEPEPSFTECHQRGGPHQTYKELSFEVKIPWHKPLPVAQTGQRFD